jgi:diguanylate cyclase (GGDEF)-like protein
MNATILEYQAGEKDIQEFESNNDEIGLMIKEFFIMKKIHDDDYAKIEKLSVTDSLTDIFNRRAFVEKVTSSMKLALRNGSTFSILLMDIDFFKKINDTYGHLVGDEILKYFVKSVSSEIRGTDIFARFGGEEFIIMLPDTNEEGAVALAQKIREHVDNNPYKASDGVLEVVYNVSIGVAQLHNEKLLKDLVQRADKALYSAKANGRNRVEIA